MYCILLSFACSIFMKQNLLWSIWKESLLYMEENFFNKWSKSMLALLPSFVVVNKSVFGIYSIVNTDLRPVCSDCPAHTGSDGQRHTKQHFPGSVPWDTQRIESANWQTQARLLALHCAGKEKQKLAAAISCRTLTDVERKSQGWISFFSLSAYRHVLPRLKMCIFCWGLGLLSLLGLVQWC